MSSGILLHLLVLSICNLVLFPETLAFPQQAVFTALQVTDDGNTLLDLQREKRSAGLQLDDEFSGMGSGDGGPNESIDKDKNGAIVEPIPPVRIGSLHIISSTTARFTNTSISSKLINRANISQEAEVSLRLPDEAFITELFIEVDGKIYRSTVETKQKAQKIYDQARERGQTASQVKQKSEKDNEFSVSVNVAAGGSVKCTLIYQQLLLRKKGFFENIISIRPNQIIPDLKVNVYIVEPQGLEEVSAWLQKEQGNDFTTTDHHVNLTTPTRAHVLFQPSKGDQSAQSKNGIVGDFVIKYDVKHPLNGGHIQVVNGYFVHHFSPEGMRPNRKNVVFVIDVSGSMSGTKIYQTREAMLTIIDQLREGDTFNIVTFHSVVASWRPDTLVAVTHDTIKEAKEFVRGLRALTSTNLHGGIEMGVSLLESYHASNNNIYADKTLSMMIMLSDGLPSSGLTNLNQIKERTKDNIDGRYSLFNLGFGNDVDDTFLEQLAGQNQGIFRKIYVDSDSSLQLAGFFDEVATPLYNNVKFIYKQNAVDMNSVTQTTFPTYFEGSELVVAGKLLDGVNDIKANVIASSSEHGVLGIITTGSTELSESVTLNPHAVENFTQRLWAYLTIKELLRGKLVSDDAVEKHNLTTRALEMSLKYHFVTPLTSLVVVKPDNNDTIKETSTTDKDTTVNIRPVPMGRSSAPSSLMLAPNMMHGPATPGLFHHSFPMHLLSGGAPPSHQPVMLLSADSDPHFLLHVPHGNVTVCFNVMGKPGDIFNLVTDAKLDLSINANVQLAVTHPELLKKKMAATTTDLPQPTIFDEMYIRFMDHRIKISSKGIVINNLTMPWNVDWNIVQGNLTVAVTDGKYFQMYVKEDVQFIVMYHEVTKKHPAKSDFFGLYIKHGDGFSQQVHGLIGQFQQTRVHLYTESIRIDDNYDKSGILRVNYDHTVNVKHASRDVLLTGAIETCWFASNNGYGLVEGTIADYLQDSQFSA